MIQEILKISKTNSSVPSIIITWHKFQSQSKPMTAQKSTLNWQLTIAKNVIYLNDIRKLLWDSSTTVPSTLTWNLRNLKFRISTILLKSSTSTGSTKIIQPGERPFHHSKWPLTITITEAGKIWTLSNSNRSKIHGFNQTFN